MTCKSGKLSAVVGCSLHFYSTSLKAIIQDFCTLKTRSYIEGLAKQRHTVLINVSVIVI